ncbi:MAG: hypothetical protein K2K85_00980 [Clostridia bacterium]|nr:hypothetical protein [Clostridia bacterium]
MKFFKRFLVATLLIVVLSTSIVLCACNTNQQPIDDPDQTTIIDQPSGEQSSGEQLPGEETKEDSIIVTTPNRDYEVKFYRAGNLNTKEGNYSAIINSAEELTTFCDMETSPYFKKMTIEDIKQYGIPDDKLNDEEFIEQLDEMFNGDNKKMIEILKEYDADYFQNKSIIILFRSRPYDTVCYSLSSLEVNAGSIDITLSTPKTTDYLPCVVGNHAYIIEVDKEKVANVTNINVKEIEE